jgi:hypothetical protein
VKILSITLIKLLCENPKYKAMTPEEVFGKFVSFKLMVKDSKHVKNIAHSNTSTPKLQAIAFKATKEKRKRPLQAWGFQ